MSGFSQPPLPSEMQLQQTQGRFLRDGVPQFSRGDPEMWKVQDAFESAQVELLFQNRKVEDAVYRLQKLEVVVDKMAKIALEKDDLRSHEIREKHEALTLLTRRTEDSLLTLDTLQKRMETVEHLMPGFERTLAEMRRIPEATEVLKRDVTDLQQAMRECVANQEHSFRRLDAMQSIFEENNKLRSDVAMMKRATERRDLDAAAMQGQLDALTKMVRERMQPPTDRSVGSRGLADFSEAVRAVAET